MVDVPVIDVPVIDVPTADIPSTVTDDLPTLDLPTDMKSLLPVSEEIVTEDSPNESIAIETFSDQKVRVLSYTKY